jgi:chromosomal replication initiation ATPase DnaA
MTRQLLVARPVRDWLLARLPREPAAIRHAVRLLDEAALASGGPITIPLARASLAAFLTEPPDAMVAENDR